VEQLVTLLQNHIGNMAEWQGYGGEVSSLQEFDGDMIIKTTPENHVDIAMLFAALRTNRAQARRIHDEQVRDLRSHGTVELMDTLRRMEMKFDDYNWEREKERRNEAERSAKPAVDY
jgi:hypothetical protein